MAKMKMVMKLLEIPQTTHHHQYQKKMKQQPLTILYLCCMYKGRGNKIHFGTKDKKLVRTTVV